MKQYNMMSKGVMTFVLVLGTLLMNLSTSYSQATLQGRVINDLGEPLLGANVVILGTTEGTSTDEDGNFEMVTSVPLPLSLEVSYTGYSLEEIEVLTGEKEIEIVLFEGGDNLLVVTVTAASKKDESIMDAPVTIEKVDLIELRSTPSIDAYGALSSLKGVQSNTGSLTFTSVNTRGFADMQNWRFVQLIDGVDASAPGLNYPVGGNSGPADIDIASMELLPGANSALYGANAFNGLLAIKTKDPFLYQGLSGYMKAGFTVQDAGGVNPLLDMGFRYAKSFNDKFAFKINLGYMKATDWTADDESFYINTSRSVNPEPFLSLPRNDPNFDAVNVYGDEVQAQVDLMGNGQTTAINRTGIKESDIVDYNVDLFKADASVYYRFSDNLEASYGYRYIQSDAILRHTTIYPLVNLYQQFHRFELKGKDWNIKAFNSNENSADSYTMLVTGAFIEQGRKSNEDWASDYGAAFRGEVNGVAAGNHDGARVYADRDMPAVGSDIFQTLREQTINNPDLTTGGSKFIDKTSINSIDGNYEFSSIKNILNLQVGASFRQFRLVSEGQLFNDGPLGFNKPIPVSEYGTYIQAGKKFAKDRIHLRSSLRFDKHQDFKGKLTPRVSMVLGLDKYNDHNLRVSYQTGFRNPSSQEGYINLDIGSAILLGGIKNNVDNVIYERPDGIVVNGNDIHDGLVTLASYQAFLGSGGTDPSLLAPANLNYMVQEKNTTWEIGYRSFIANKWFIDLNYYNTFYDDLVVRITSISPEAGRAFAVYTNIDDRVTSYGFGIGTSYMIGNGLKLGFNYTYNTYDADEAVKNQPGFLPSFNTPENRFNFTFSGTSVGNSDFGFNIKYRYWDAYDWQSPFGLGALDAGNVVDLALNYKFTKMKSMIKIGATNLLNNEYRTVYGGPAVGSIYYVSWTYDQMFGDGE